LQKWASGVSSLTQESLRSFSVSEMKAAWDECKGAMAKAGTKVKAVIEERKKWALEGWQAIKTLDCGKIVETFSKFDPMQQALNAALPEFVAECGIQAKKGFICEIPEVLKGAWDLISNAASTAWDNKLACGAAAVLTANPASALACGLGIYIGKQVPKMIAGAKKIWQCLSSFKAKQWFSLVKGAACHFAGAMALEAVLGALSHGASVPAFIGKVAHYTHELLHVAHLGGGKPAHALIAAAHEIGHMCGGHGGSGEHGSSSGGHGTTGDHGGTSGGHGTATTGGHGTTSGDHGSTSGGHGGTTTGGHGTATTSGGSTHGTHTGHGTKPPRLRVRRTGSTTGHGSSTSSTTGPATQTGSTGQTSTGKPGYVNGVGVNFRKSASTSASVLKVGYKCDPVTILEQGVKGPGAAAWTKVKYKGLEGYMASSYVAEGSCPGK
ncbi:MAG: SH3 domain-containing protein, partial [Deltaproteobacteria bacterium]|nr:SH3 domain-containing protein [Deltaproteobacteria bacterium]